MRGINLPRASLLAAKVVVLHSILACSHLLCFNYYKTIEYCIFKVIIFIDTYH